jgi:hypothetical protein
VRDVPTCAGRLCRSQAKEDESRYDDELVKALGHGVSVQDDLVLEKRLSYLDLVLA